MCSLGKILLCLEVKSRYFTHNKSTNLFPFDIDRVIGQTYTHISMHARLHTYIQRYTYIHAYMHKFIHTKHPHYPIDHRQCCRYENYTRTSEMGITTPLSVPYLGHFIWNDLQLRLPILINK